MGTRQYALFCEACGACTPPADGYWRANYTETWMFCDKPCFEEFQTAVALAAHADPNAFITAYAQHTGLVVQYRAVYVRAQLGEC